MKFPFTGLALNELNLRVQKRTPELKPLKPQPCGKSQIWKAQLSPPVPLPAKAGQEFCVLVLCFDTQGQAQSVKETAPISINTERDNSSRVMDLPF